MSTAPVHFDRLLDPVVACLTPEVAARLAELRPNEALQDRLDYLADRCTEGLLTAEEREEYEGYIHANNLIAILQAKARSMLRGRS